MISLSWNCRGLGNPRTVRELQFWVKPKCPNVAFLMETKCGRKKVEEVRKLVGFDRSFVVESKGFSGGLAFLWNNTDDFSLDNYSHNHISLSVKSEETNEDMLVTGFYGHPSTSQRESTWQLLKVLKPNSDKSWICFRDFNEVMHQHEKQGAALRPYNQMERFREAVDSSGLSDLGYDGTKYTWNNGREGAYFTKKRLGSLLRGVHNKLLICRDSLIQWKHLSLDKYRRQAQEKIKLLSNLQNANTGALTKEVKQVQKEMGIQLEEDNVRWRQRAKQTWLRKGDRNTKFFHRVANQRRRTNEIHNIVKEDGSVMNPLGSLGPDGFPTVFYHNHWDIVGVDVTRAVLEILNSNGDMSCINQTYIVLIPKVKKAQVVTDFRPISLCNVIYKIISKVLANKLKLILPQIISPTQSAFVPGRLILDNVIMAFEAMHSMSSKVKGRQGYMSLRLDMSKAYDRVE
ncbi:hypothetical protein F2P56_001303 [Juglans regia]|uniref:Uncharacterized protein LOC108996133 n=2 Tax=Juglans regia TaxID=51240 RepID=A0A2I4F724_JUGRE|nr:uncharacterized protein LOC108996133 [Juglans regia]KAF5480564.1 hypothetical protein F2P56_001303 [Juglans regia]